MGDRPVTIEEARPVVEEVLRRGMEWSAMRERLAAKDKQIVALEQQLRKAVAAATSPGVLRTRALGVVDMDGRDARVAIQAELNDRKVVWVTRVSRDRDGQWRRERGGKRDAYSEKPPEFQYGWEISTPTYLWASCNNKDFFNSVAERLTGIDSAAIEWLGGDLPYRLEEAEDDLLRAMSMPDRSDVDELMRQLIRMRDNRQALSMGEANGATSFVYLIGSDESEHVKIGFSVNPAGRLASLQTARTDRLEILATFEGTMQDEAELHEQFGHLRVSGEWFTDHPDIRAAFAAREAS